MNANHQASRAMQAPATRAEAVIPGAVHATTIASGFAVSPRAYAGEVPDAEVQLARIDALERRCRALEVSLHNLAYLMPAGYELPRHDAYRVTCDTDVQDNRVE